VTKSRRGRPPSPEERALWDRVARTANPLDGARPPKPTDPPNAPGPQKPKGQTRIPEDFSVGRAASAPSAPKTVANPPASLDRKTSSRLKRGQTAPEARIDLHGMTLAEAHPALIRFILSAQAKGQRLVLVITGKGKSRDHGGPVPARTGVLKQQVPVWLRSGALAGVVLDAAPAHQRHGGEGAYYVTLRRLRK